ncbi:hypothetical protein D3C71_1543590 [compost metagenome]
MPQSIIHQRPDRPAEQQPEKIAVEFQVLLVAIAKRVLKMAEHHGGGVKKAAGTVLFAVKTLGKA